MYNSTPIYNRVLCWTYHSSIYNMIIKEASYLTILWMLCKIYESFKGQIPYWLRLDYCTYQTVVVDYLYYFPSVYQMCLKVKYHLSLIVSARALKNPNKNTIFMYCICYICSYKIYFSLISPSTGSTGAYTTMSETFPFLVMKWATRILYY